MIPIEKVQAIVSRHDNLEKELSSGKVEPKLFAAKSKEYSSLGNIILYAREFLKYGKETEDLEALIKDKSSDLEMIKLAEKDLEDLNIKIQEYENKLKIFLLPKDEDDDKNAIVEIRSGTGGDEAALFAARANRRKVAMEQFELAKDKVIMGVERRSIVMPEEERLNTAYHESGHTVVAKVLAKNTDPVHKVTIIPRGRALGVTMQLPEEDRYSHNRDHLLARIAVLMGGRIAEEVFMDQMKNL